MQNNKKLFLANPRGFCAGVVRAINIVEKALEKWGAPIYVRHEIVHNRHVVGALKEKGVIFVEELADVPSGSRVIYSAHGIPPQVREEAKEKNLIDIDATCVLVTKIHSAVKRFSAKGYNIILIGHKGHQEVIGIKGEVSKNVTVVECVDDVDLLNFSNEDKIFFVTQTTLSTDDVQDISNRLLERYPQSESLPSSSVCYATVNRQQALRHLLKDINLIYVVGDIKSSNSNRLCEVAMRRGVKAFLINGPEDIDPSIVAEHQYIGITAGASTPEDIVQSCIAMLMTLGVSEIENTVFAKEDIIFQLPKELCNI